MSSNTAEPASPLLPPPFLPRAPEAGCQPSVTTGGEEEGREERDEEEGGKMGGMMSN